MKSTFSKDTFALLLRRVASGGCPLSRTQKSVIATANVWAGAVVVSNRQGSSTRIENLKSEILFALLGEDEMNNELVHSTACM